MSYAITKDNINELTVDGHNTKWYIVWPDGVAYDGPFNTPSSAKRELTKLKKEYA
jgi:hypothetical protein